MLPGRVGRPKLNSLHLLRELDLRLFWPRASSYRDFDFNMILLFSFSYKYLDFAQTKGNMLPGEDKNQTFT
jgi:hypothetical protein